MWQESTGPTLASKAFNEDSVSPSRMSRMYKLGRRVFLVPVAAVAAFWPGREAKDFFSATREEADAFKPDASLLFLESVLEFVLCACDTLREVAAGPPLRVSALEKSTLRLSVIPKCFPFLAVARALAAAAGVLNVTKTILRFSLGRGTMFMNLISG
ncbi:hypothetical protein BC830DRAFT_926773 [Chytriomyces sp. MP71]|nr:hypothetical protein BC830DRAFT_926773 [Chytriomyces sp. MP71]